MRGRKSRRSKLCLELADAAFTPVYLRNATAYGHSPMLRIDLVVNNLLASAMSYGEIRIQSDGSPWRPLIHCRDIARAFAAFAQAPREAIHGQAVNVGGNKENYQVRDVGDQVKRLIPTAKVVYTGEVGADPRNYRVNFDKLSRVLPDFRLQYNLVSGMEELHRKMVEHGFGKERFRGRPVRAASYAQGPIQSSQLTPMRENPMIFTETPLKGAYLIDLEKRGDERGFFARAFCEREFASRARNSVRPGQQFVECSEGDAAWHALSAWPQRPKPRSSAVSVGRSTTRSWIYARAHRLSVRASVPSYRRKTAA